MKTVWKFNVSIQEDFSLLMPRGAKILKLDLQQGEPKIWALVDSDNPAEERNFIGRGTGHLIDNPVCDHIGTVVMMNGTFVYHVFEVK